MPLHLLIKIWIMNILIAGFLFSLIQILVFQCMKVVSYQTSFQMDASTSLSVFLSVSLCLSVSLFLSVLEDLNLRLTHVHLSTNFAENDIFLIY